MPRRPKPAQAKCSEHCLRIRVNNRGAELNQRFSSSIGVRGSGRSLKRETEDYRDAPKKSLDT